MDFIALSKTKSIRTPAFLLQSIDRGCKSEPYIRVGVTCSKKLGGAVIRNRAKRRLRHLANKILPLHGLPHRDYVLIGLRYKTNSRKFVAMEDDLKCALRQIHKKTEA